MTTLHHITNDLSDNAAKVTDKIDAGLQRAASDAQDLGHKVAGKAIDAIETARDNSSEALDKLSDKVDSIQHKGKAGLRQAAETLGDLKARSAEACHETSEKVRDQVTVARDCTINYIQNAPIKSMLVAAAAGAVLAGAFSLINASQRRRDRQST